MASVRTKSELSIGELLKRVEQLDLLELDEFVFRVTALQAKHKSYGLSDEEKELLLKIYQGLPSDIQTRYVELVAKQESETLLPDEHQELLHLIDWVEAMETKRVKHMAKLAHLRKTPLESLVEALNISFYTDALDAYLDTYRPDGITATLNRIYETETSTIDPVISQLQAILIGDEDW